MIWLTNLTIFQTEATSAKFLLSSVRQVQSQYQYPQQWFTSVSHTRSWLCYFLLWDRKWRSHPGRGEKWVRDRDRLFIFCPITSQLRVWDTDVNHCCGSNEEGTWKRLVKRLRIHILFIHVEGRIKSIEDCGSQWSTKGYIPW